jgi:hypothetical protein
MDRARHVCAHCARIIGVTKGTSHAFAMAGKKYCSWCYNSLYLNDSQNKRFAVEPAEFLKRADPKFFEELLQKIAEQGESILS